MPADTQRYEGKRFVQETNEIFRVLKEAFVDLDGRVDGVRGRAKIPDLVAGEKCSLGVDVQYADDDMEVGKRVLILMEVLNGSWIC